MKKAGLLLCVILFSQCQKGRISEEPNPDFIGNLYKTNYGFSIKLYPEYKKIRETKDGVLFSSKNGEIAIIVFKENVAPIKKFYFLTYSTSTLKLKNCYSYLFTEDKKEGFRRLKKVRLEIFPEERDIQITIIAFEEKKYNKMMDMLSTIKIE